tara:strand:- start:18715 stop:19515 length:801 start_codon:yes stop_codon:yes gene_type:complete
MDKNIPTTNVMKDTFGWEVPQELVPIPSEGKIYDPNSTLYGKKTVQIKAMTAKEEDILTSQAFLKEGTVIENLIKSCLIDDTFDVNDLINGDRNAILVSVRITGYGGEYAVVHGCAKCSSKNNVDVDLGSLAIKRLQIEPVEEGKNLFIYELPVTKKNVVFKFLTGKDEKDEEVRVKRMEALNIQQDNSVTRYLEQIIVSVDGVTDKNKIHHFVKNMPALDSRKLRMYSKSQEPGIDMSWKYNCESCGQSNEFTVPITPEFFWPST